MTARDEPPGSALLRPGPADTGRDHPDDTGRNQPSDTGRNQPSDTPLPVYAPPERDGSRHPVLAELLADLRARERSGEPALAYYEDSPFQPPQDPPGGADPDSFRQFVLKVHSRCNLACTYCYLYRGPDSTWRDHPSRAEETVMRQTAHRVAEHARTHRLRVLRADLHGGEPLLSGPEPVVTYVDLLRAAVPRGTEVVATVQTNGTLLTGPVLDRLAGAGILVGLSLDGGTARLNRRRPDHAGRPSWPALRRAATLLAEGHTDTYAGILCTIDPATAADEVYTSLRAFAPPTLDFLLPHTHWGTRPPGRHRPAPTPYGDWLVHAFDLWWNDTAPGRPRVRLFAEIVTLMLGGSSRTEAVGLSPVTAVIVETDGTIERIDSLRATYHGASTTGLDVFRHSFDTALRHPGITVLRDGAAALGEECRECPVVRVCGGGNHAHRYAPTTGHFRHPSVHCPDLEQLVRHAAARVGEQLSATSRTLT